MTFSNDADALIKNLYWFKEYRSPRVLTEFSKINWNREGLDTLLKKRFEKQEAPTKGMRAAD